MDFNEIYEFTLELEPNADGIALLEPVYITENEYKLLEKSNSFWDLNKEGKVNYGEGYNDSIRFVTVLGSLSQFKNMMDKVSLFSYILINDGIPKSKVHKEPRKDLLDSLNNAKIYINRKIKSVPGLDSYFPANTVYYLDKISKNTKLFNIHETNKRNTKRGFNLGKDIPETKESLNEAYNKAESLTPDIEKEKIKKAQKVLKNKR